MMATAIAAGLRYVAVVFAIGFLLGVLRTLVVAPRIGAVAAVALELPFMLAASWLACRWLVRDVSPRLLPRLLMGATAFAALIGVEFATAVALFGQAPAAWLAGFGTLAGQLGLAGQIGFALMPLVTGRRPGP